MTTTPATAFDLDSDLDSVLDDVLDDVLESDATDTETTTETAEPYIAALPIDQLFADHTYQRELDEVRVQRMAANYRIALVGIIEVSRRSDDRYAILDGQHRWATIRDVSFDAARPPHLACRVHEGLTLTDEAALYHQLNTTRKQLTGWDRWLARRGAGDPTVVTIEQTLARHDLIVGPGAGDNVFRATRAAEIVTSLGGVALLDQVINVIRAAWPADQSGMDGAIVHGLGHVLDNYSREELDTARLIEVLTGMTPRQLTARASAARELHTGTLDRLTGHVIVDRYNASKGDRVQPFFARVKPVSKTKTAKAKAEAEYRAAALAWASETAWCGRRSHTRLTPALREAYDQHRATTTTPEA